MTEEIKETIIEEKPVKATKKKVDVKAWKNRKLTYVNAMSNKAKAEGIAKRVLSHK